MSQNQSNKICFEQLKAHIYLPNAMELAKCSDQPYNTIGITTDTIKKTFKQNFILLLLAYAIKSHSWSAMQ